MQYRIYVEYGFNNIYNRAIHVYAGPGFTSAFNTFARVAENGLGAGNPSTHIIDFASTVNAHSIADTFLRGDGDDTITTRRISTDANHVDGMAVDLTGVKFGGWGSNLLSTAITTKPKTNNSLLLIFPRLVLGILVIKRISSGSWNVDSFFRHMFLTYKWSIFDFFFTNKYIFVFSFDSFPTTAASSIPLSFK